MNLLFVCSRNRWRSPTAERLFADHPGVHTRSAGTASSARHRVSERDLDWADLVLVMEHHHKDALRERFRRAGHLPRIVVLDIPDEHGFMDPALIDALMAAMEAHLP